MSARWLDRAARRRRLSESAMSDPQVPDVVRSIIKSISGIVNLDYSGIKLAS